MTAIASLRRLSAHRIGRTASWSAVFQKGLAKVAVQKEAAHGLMFPVAQLSTHASSAAGLVGAE
jgi:hypothetical protein